MMLLADCLACQWGDHDHHQEVIEAVPRGVSEPSKLDKLAAELGILEKQLASLRMKYRKQHGKQGDAKLEAWLRKTAREMRDEDEFLRAGALPSDLGSRATNPRSPALGRGRTGMKREPGKGRRRRLRKIVKPPTAAQIEQAAEQSAYITYRDSLDAGAVPLGYQKELAVEARTRFAEHKQEAQAEDQARGDVRRITARMKAVTIQAARSGVDPTHILARFEHDLAALEAQLRDAA